MQAAKLLIRSGSARKGKSEGTYGIQVAMSDQDPSLFIDGKIGSLREAIVHNGAPQEERNELESQYCVASPFYNSSGRSATANFRDLANAGVAMASLMDGTSQRGSGSSRTGRTRPA